MPTKVLMHVEIKNQYELFSSTLPFFHSLIFETGSLTEQGSNWLANLRETFASISPALGIQACTTTLSFGCAWEGTSHTNLGPRACMVTALRTESSPHMLNYIFREIHGFRKYSAPQVNTLLILHMFNGHIFSRGQHIRSTSEHYISNEKHDTLPLPQCQMTLTSGIPEQDTKG